MGYNHIIGLQKTSLGDCRLGWGPGSLGGCRLLARAPQSRGSKVWCLAPYAHYDVSAPAPGNNERTAFSFTRVNWGKWDSGVSGTLTISWPQSRTAKNKIWRHTTECPTYPNAIRFTFVSYQNWAYQALAEKKMAKVEPNQKVGAKLHWIILI